MRVSSRNQVLQLMKLKRKSRTS